MAGCTDNHIWLSEQRGGRLWVYDSVHIPDLVFLLSVFQMSQKPLWQVTIRDDRLNSHVPDFLFTWFRNRSCHPFFLCGCRFFPCGIMVCYRMGRAISITTMNYSVAIFVYSRMIRYPDNAITELQYSRISLFWYLEARVARTLPDTDISKSPFTEVYKYQSINGDDEKTIRRIRLPVILHLQKCRSSNPLMETMKKQLGIYSYMPFSICRSVEVAIR